MASSPLSTTAPSLGDLPLELHWTLAQYLGGKDLAQMRLLSSDWNATAKTTLRKRKPLTFNIAHVTNLIVFNDTFVNYEPPSHIAAGRFCFQLPVLETVAAAAHLDTFIQNFVHLVTTLSVNLFEPRRLALRPGGLMPLPEEDEWFNDPRKRATVLGHVSRLLQWVKGHVQDLDLVCYVGLDPSVIGHGPFPRLRTLSVRTGRFPVRDGRFLPPLASLYPATHEEALVLHLSRSVPAIQRFELQVQTDGHSRGDPLFLAKVLRNLVEVNGQVEVKLDMDLECRFAGGGALPRELTTVAVRIVELDLVVRRSFEALGTALAWIGAQSDWLRKLTFKVKLDDEDEWLGGLRLPRLRALEELNYVQKTVESLLVYDSPDYYPNLRKVSTASTGNDFTVALPQVTDLTLERSRFTELVRWKRQGIYGGAAFRLPPFPNLEALTCSVKFIDLGSIVQLTRLRRFTFSPDVKSDKVFSFWKKVAHGAGRLTLNQIRALPEPSDDEVRERAEPCFSDLPNLKEFKMIVYEVEEDEAGEMTTVNLDALLWLSKTKRLQRLEKLELSGGDGGYIAASLIPTVYLTELRQYHNSVIVS